MLYKFLVSYFPSSYITTLFQYVVFRTILAIFFSLIASLLIGKKLIFFLKNWQKDGQPIREYIPHKKKVPTMGGIGILLSIITTTIFFVDLKNPYLWITIFTLISLSILGFIDDYLKIKLNNFNGISAKKKIIIQTIIGIISIYFIIRYDTSNYYRHLNFPFIKNLIINLDYWYIPFTLFVIIGSSNAVNVTDGLDGLVLVPVITVTSYFMVIAYLVGKKIFFQKFHIIYIPNVMELTIICASIVGSCLGFLWFNSYPASVFMGDVGSLSLGGALGVISVILKHEIMLPIVGGVFVIEALSIIIQVSYFKLSKGKRVFLMSPIHHHFEKVGLPESKIVIRFWILSIIFTLIAISSIIIMNII